MKVALVSANCTDAAVAPPDTACPTTLFTKAVFPLPGGFASIVRGIVVPVAATVANDIIAANDASPPEEG